MAAVVLPNPGPCDIMQCTTKEEAKYRFTFSFGPIFLAFTACKNLHLLFLLLQYIIISVTKSYWVFRKNNITKYSTFNTFILI